MYTIEAKNISKIFAEEKKEFHALRNVSLKIKKGEIYGLLGPNGAGKTTLVYILSTLLTPTSGEAHVLDLDVIKQADDVRKKIGVCFGSSNFFWSFTPAEILNYYGMLYGLKREERSQKIKYLSKLLDFGSFKDKRFMNLSKGMKQKIAVAKSLINDPEVLFMDEPTVGLDVDVATDVRDLLNRLVKEKEITVLLTSHNMNEIEMLCKRITLLNKGRVIREGDVGEIEKSLKFPERIWFSLGNYDNIKFIRKFKFVKRFSADENGISIDVENAEESVCKLINEIKKRKIKILDMEVRKVSLEETFLKIIQKNRRNKKVV